jgi:methionine sulfoxide reductase heme-binding subunit
VGTRGITRRSWPGPGAAAAHQILTYYPRDRVGAARWRRLHRLTAVFWLLAVTHTIGAGSDAAEWWFLLLSGALVVPAALLLTLRWAGRASDSQALPESIATQQRAS